MKKIKVEGDKGKEVIIGPPRWKTRKGEDFLREWDKTDLK